MSEQRRSVDPEILALLAREDKAGAVTCALQAYGPRILGYYTLVLRDGDAADEVYGAFCENLWRGIGTFRGEARFQTWAFQIAHNVMCSYRTDPDQRRGRRLSTAELANLTQSARDGTPLFQHTTMKSAVERLREQLDPDERALLALRVDQRLSWREVTQILSQEEGVNEAVLRKRFERIKERLRGLAELDGLLPTEDGKG